LIFAGMTKILNFGLSKCHSRQFPIIPARVMAYDIGSAIIATQLEIAVVGSQAAIDYIGHLG
jgi:hypothetical protein